MGGLYSNELHLSNSKKFPPQLDCGNGVDETLTRPHGLRMQIKELDAALDALGWDYRRLLAEMRASPWIDDDQIGLNRPQVVYNWRARGRVPVWAAVWIRARLDVRTLVSAQAVANKHGATA